MSLCFHPSDSYLPAVPSPVGGDGIENSPPDFDSLPESCASRTQWFHRHDHNPKAKDPHRPFKWSIRRLHTIHQKVHEHWLWSGNYYRVHNGPSKQAVVRIKSLQTRVILSSKTIGPKRAGVQAFIQTWTRRGLVKRRKQDQRRSWKEARECVSKNQTCEEIHARLPFEREKERERPEGRPEGRQQRRRPPSLERQDAFRDEETSKRRREMVRRYDRGWEGPEYGKEEGYGGESKIRVAGHKQIMDEKHRSEAAAQGGDIWSQTSQHSQLEGLDMELLFERHLAWFCWNGLRLERRRARV
ncbi:hypothetical protein QBC41DRAFT_130875 [Cercophora samala]|uniref:Uncharacterized protein n=1 Tax=Cercophora samala TaxID=330535 RepID=A0AA39ZCJ6_9PEZI|nr:hypothetical protein QBC41DRAFT_130875 [Cercophora samala]